MGIEHFELDPERSQVWIEGSSSIHPIRATASGLVGRVAISLVDDRLAVRPHVEGEVRIAVDRLSSGNPLVDAETRRRIDARRHPEIIGLVTGVSAIAPDRVGLTGEITFRGETRPVEGELEVERTAEGVRLAGEARFDVRDWGLTPPRLGLVRVHPEITVRLEAHGSPREP